MPRSARKAGNQALFRQVNQRIAEVASRFEVNGEPQSFVCECHRLGCAELIQLPVTTYAQVREDPTMFLVLRGHEDPEHEAVISENDGYLIVRNEPGGSRRLARARRPEAADPGRPGGAGRSPQAA